METLLNGIKMYRLFFFPISVFLLFSIMASEVFFAKSALAEPPVVSSQLSIVFPIVSPRLSSKFGTRKHPVYKSVRHHNGLDLAVPEGSFVRAVYEGEVVFAGVYKGYGKLVTIRHRSGYTSLYGHLSEISIKLGQKVKKGDLIGKVGETGTATGPHLHFEWRRKGKPVDPLKAFPSFLAPAKG